MTRWRPSYCTAVIRGSTLQGRGGPTSSSSHPLLPLSPLPPASILHPLTPSLFLLTKQGVDAYKAYHQPNILEHYSYTRPPFQFPPVQGYIQKLGVTVDLPAHGDGPSVEEEGVSVGGMSPISVATTAEMETGSPQSMSLSPASPTSRQSRGGL